MQIDAKDRWLALQCCARFNFLLSLHNASIVIAIGDSRRQPYLIHNASIAIAIGNSRRQLYLIHPPALQLRWATADVSKI
jgi:hypothetical protein